MKFTILTIGTFKQKFKLVDCWHLRDRNKEKIEQSFREISQFISSVVRSSLVLEDEINDLKAALSTD
jgi:hypothetical protein